MIPLRHRDIVICLCACVYIHQSFIEKREKKIGGGGMEQFDQRSGKRCEIKEDNMLQTQLVWEARQESLQPKKAIDFRLELND